MQNPNIFSYGNSLHWFLAENVIKEITAYIVGKCGSVLANSPRIIWGG